MKNGIEIPDGCEARIEGNKVVFVPKESEDERIRKALLRCCDDWEKGQFGCMNAADIPAIRAYLERQKEYIEDIRQYAYNKGLVDAEEKQNPTELSEDDEKNRCPLNTKEIEVGDIITYFNNGKKGIMLVSSFDSGIYPRCKWGISDIDGNAYGDWATGYGPYYIATEKEKQQLYNTMPREVKDWLNSLRPQPKQGWSKEDERVIHDAHCWLDEYAGFLVSANKDKAKMLWKHSEKLKHIRPLPHWKPSEEQICALERAIIKMHTPNDIGILAELRDNLKKL